LDAQKYFVGQGNELNAIASAVTFLELFRLTPEMAKVLSSDGTKKKEPAEKKPRLNTDAVLRSVDMPPLDSDEEEDETALVEQAGRTEKRAAELAQIKKLWPGTFDHLHPYTQARLAYAKLGEWAVWDDFDTWCKANVNFLHKDLNNNLLFATINAILKMFEKKSNNAKPLPSYLTQGLRMALRIAVPANIKDHLWLLKKPKDVDRLLPLLFVELTASAHFKLSRIAEEKAALGSAGMMEEAAPKAGAKGKKQKKTKKKAAPAVEHVREGVTLLEDGWNCINSTLENVPQDSRDLACIDDASLVQVTYALNKEYRLDDRRSVPTNGPIKPSDDDVDMVDGELGELPDPGKGSGKGKCKGVKILKSYVKVRALMAKRLKDGHPGFEVVVDVEEDDDEQPSNPVKPATPAPADVDEEHRDEGDDGDEDDVDLHELADLLRVNEKLGASYIDFIKKNALKDCYDESIKKFVKMCPSAAAISSHIWSTYSGQDDGGLSPLVALNTFDGFVAFLSDLYDALDGIFPDTYLQFGDVLFDRVNDDHPTLQISDEHIVESMAEVVSVVPGLAPIASVFKSHPRALMNLMTLRTKLMSVVVHDLQDASLMKVDDDVTM